MFSELSRFSVFPVPTIAEAGQRMEIKINVHNSLFCFLCAKMPVAYASIALNDFVVLLYLRLLDYMAFVAPRMSLH